MEQDPRSQRDYLGGKHTPDQDDTAVFIDASDGMFCLSLVVKISKVYLFAPGSHWHEPLNATFALWGDKVVIFPYAAASKDTDKLLKLDTFFSGDKSLASRLGAEGLQAVETRYNIANYTQSYCTLIADLKAGA